MKQIQISLQGLVDAFGIALLIVFGGLVGYIMCIDIWHMANPSWWWKIPAIIGGFIAFITIMVGIQWIYDKNPTIKIGGKPKLPKAMIFTGEK
jgi:hypothetical protein